MLTSNLPPLINSENRSEGGGGKLALIPLIGSFYAVARGRAQVKKIQNFESSKIFVAPFSNYKLTKYRHYFRLSQEPEPEPEYPHQKNNS